MKVRVRSGKHYRNVNGETMRFVEGDEFDATEAEVSGFGDRFEAIDEATIGSERGLWENSGNIAISIATNGPESANEKISVDLSIETPTRETVEGPGDGLRNILPDEIAVALEAAGINTMEKLAEIAGDPEQLSKVKGIGKAKARKIREVLMGAEA